MTTIQNQVPQSVLDSMNPKKDANKSAASEAQDRFMTMLVAQMRNQDPLNPLDNAQVTSQLAQLSTVTGVEKLNSTMEAMMDSYQTSQTLQAASMIGHGVLTPGSGLQLAGSGSEEEGKVGLMGVELSQPVDKLEVTIYDITGKEVQKLNLGEQKAGVLPIAWDGKTADGTDAPGGTYTFKVEAALGSESVNATALQFGMVSSVTTGTQGVTLNVPGLGEVKFTDVRQIL
jgi:flagellar basal-body rod modification protein FlgD